jgi:enamine deaminase RidA (YjgF/YER057c/UK114 family)
MNAEHRLAALGLTLPQAKAPAGNYASAVRSGNLLFVSGRAPGAVNGVAPKGRLGREYSAADGYAFARSACLDLLAVVKASLGSLDAVAQFVELHGALNAEPTFEDHAAVLDGASDLLAAVFGDAGLHARSVVGVSSLRNGVPLTLKAIVEVRPADAPAPQGGGA